MKEIYYYWNWTDFCGPKDNFIVWDPVQKNIGQCFQSLCLQFPILSLLAVISSWFCGKQTNWIVRSKIELNILNIRFIVTLLLFLLPIIRIYVEINNFGLTILPINYFLSAVQALVWIVHAMYILVLRHRLGAGIRGPLIMNFVWTLNFFISLITLWSTYSMLKSSSSIVDIDNIPFLCSLIVVILQSLYLLTLIPSYSQIQTHYQALHHAQNNESSPLLGAYSRFSEDLDPMYLGVAMEGWSRLSLLCFTWVDPLIKKGYTGNINSSDDLFDLPLKLTPTYLSHKLEQVLENVSLLKALHRCFWKEFYSVGLLKLAADVSGFFGPLLLNRLVMFIENHEENNQDGYLCAAGLSLVTLVAAFCNAHFNFQMAKTGLKIRGALICVVYNKALRLSTITVSSFGVGKIVNFMSIDTDRIVNSCPSFHAFWSLPFQISVTLYLLYKQVGLAFLAGLGFSIILIPINHCIASKIGQLSTKLMNHKDERVKIISEILKGIKAIKMHVWEYYFIQKISGIRSKELKYLKGRKYLDAMCVYFWATTPVVISILTFATYVLLGNKLTAAKVFTSIALLNMLIAPLNAFPWVLNGLTEAWVSLKRIQSLLKKEDISVEQYYNQVLDISNENIVLAIKDASFIWGPQQFQLSKINLMAMEGQFIGIFGAVGSGKSSLLAALLGELTKLNGIIAFHTNTNDIAYVSQTPWLQHGTLRDNILFGKPYVQSKYKAVLDACALSQDVERLPGGDQVGVGNSGVTLSGGQKARVALARAIYQDRSIYLLDDILSAVDVRVATHIVQNCIFGLLRKKTRILCTHQLQYLLSSNMVLHMEDGRVINQGSPADVLPNYNDLFTSAQLECEDDTSTYVQDQPSEDLQEDINSVLEEETRETGSLSWTVYSTYLQAVGVCLMLSIFLSIILMQLSRNGTDWWMAYWVTHMENSTNLTLFDGRSWTLRDVDPVTQHFLSVYIIIAVTNSLFTLIRAFIFAYGGVKAASKLHMNLLHVIIQARTTFFDVVPVGRILNRFSSDVYTIDDSLPFILNILLAQFFGLLGCVLMATYGMPWLCLVLVTLIPIYYWLQDHYRLTSRDLKRISSVSLSPIYNHFSETLQGLMTIRGFGAVSRFRSQNESKLECNQKTQLASQAVSQWLSLRLQLIGVVMVTGVGIIAVVQHQFDMADPGLVGLAITYALSMTGLLSGVVNAFTEAEREMVSVERVEQYLSQCLIENSKSVIVAPPYAWPSQGVITFNKVFMKYRPHLPPSLSNVSFSTRPAEHIGVVGRTGAGKSSILSALFRLVDLASGEVVIDTVNIKHIGLSQLRSRMSIIPQEAFIFTATIRENVDPLKQYRENEIWTALQRCHLKTVVRNSGGLDTSEMTLSAGQAQLLCLARAVLRNAKILCIDEATANVDDATDKLIQETIRNCFRQSTVITIAHRVRTIMDSDRVLVMADGEVLEFDSPQILMQDRESHFYKLVHQDYD
uniref:ABC-type xenobiotic transporter n=1 Tax=Clastoptera arizonana TaxID=38151 RepID=A0A1B6CRI6_9HEMI